MRRLLVFALLVYCVILYRAATQAATLDEADAYNAFSTGNPDLSFYPSSGNHVLNSLLARYTTEAFGLSQFTFRIPAMLGAALYLLAAASIALRIGRERALLGFAIFTLNPFVLDYLVASRGYALALGLLATAVALGMRVLDGSARRPYLDCAGLSVCCGLAVAANFSFAFAILSLVAAFLLVVLLKGTSKWRWLGLACSTCLPGLLVGLAIVGQTLRDFPRTQLYYGAENWTEMWTVMSEAVFPRENLTFPAVPLATAHVAAGYLVLVSILIGIWAAASTQSWAMRRVSLEIGRAHV